MACPVIKPLFIALAMAMAGHVQASTPESPAGSPAVESVSGNALVAVATASALYQQALGESRFKAGSLGLTNDGYTIESGKLVTAQGAEDGDLIMVRSPDGAMVGLVAQAGRRGLLRVDASGVQTFTPEPEYDWSRPDTVAAEEASVPDQAPVQDPEVPSSRVDSDQTIDFLVGFTQAALDQYAGDPHAYALLQLESVRTSLVNSRLEHIHPALAGIRIYEEDIPTTGAGLNRWQDLLGGVRAIYFHDINVGYSLGGDTAGWGYTPGSSSVNDIRHASAFKHELGHNVGGGHCNDGQQGNYKFGYDAGDNVRSNLCGNNLLYYSNPDVVVSGRKIGHPETANMARLWREQLNRLSGYSPPYNGRRIIHVGRESDNTVSITKNDRAYYLALEASVGPVLGEQAPSLPYTELRTRLIRANDGLTYNVLLRASCKDSANEWVAMHKTGACTNGGQSTLRLQFFSADNGPLAQGWYNGMVELKIAGVFEPGNILASVAVKQ